MEGSLVTLSELKLVAIKVVGRRSELSHRVPPAWLELVRRLGEISNQVDPNMFYGAFPESDQIHDGQNGGYTYWVGTEVSEFDAIPQGLGPLTIPRQTYASATIRGRGGGEQINATYISLASWLQANGHVTNPNAYGFERYNSRRQRVTPPYERFDYDIFKPLV